MTAGPTKLPAENSSWGLAPALVLRNDSRHVQDRSMAWYGDIEASPPEDP